MADKNEWPDEEDVWDVLAGAGLMPQGPPEGALAFVDYRGPIDAAVARFERLAGYKPFLAKTGTRQFATASLASRLGDPYPWAGDVRFATLPGGVVSITEARLFEAGAYGTVDTSGEGRLLVAARDYRLLPVDGPNTNEPYTAVAFHDLLPSAGILRLVGEFGYTATLPADVRAAVLNLAVMEVAPLVNAAKFAAAGGVAGLKKREKIGDVETEIAAVAGANGPPVLFGSEAQRAAAVRRIKVLAADLREPVIV